MNFRYESPSTYFQHIPKTAGVALGNLLASAYSNKTRLQLAPAPLAHLRIEEVQQHRHYHSWHHDRGMYELVQRQELACITVLRNPIERAVSAIRYRQRCSTDKSDEFSPETLSQLLPLRHAEIGECLTHAVFRAIVDNSQTRQLGISSDYRSFFRSSDDNGQGLAQAILVPLPLLTDMPDANAVFENGCAWLAEMNVVGITERYAESMILVCDLLGLAPPKQAAQANVNPQRTGITMRYQEQLAPDVLARLQEINHYDAQLYAYGCELFEEQWARFQAQPRRIYSIAPRLRQVKAKVMPMLNKLRTSTKQL